MYAAAVALNRLDFDLLSLLSMAGFDQGGPNVHPLSPVTWLTAGVIRAGQGSTLSLPILHVIHWVMGAIALAGIYTIARFRLPVWPSWAIVVLSAINPIVLTQLGDIYLEIPLLAAATWGTVFLIKGRFVLAAVLATVATAIKPTGFVTALAMSLYLLDSDESRKRKHVVMIMSGPLVIALLQRQSLPISNLFRSGWLRTLELGVRFSGEILDVVVLTAVALAIGFYILRRSRRSVPARDVTRALIATITAFFAFYLLVPLSSVGVFLLPRYWIAVIPTALTILVMEIWNRRKVLAVISIGLLGVGYAANMYGQLYVAGISELCDRNYAILERSLESMQLLELHRAEARAAEGVDDTLYLTQPLGSALRYPEMNYIDDVPDDLHIIMPGQGWESLPVSELDLPAVLLVDSPLFGGGILLNWWKAATRSNDLAVEVTTIEAHPYQAALITVGRGGSGATARFDRRIIGAIEDQQCAGAQ